MIPTDPVLGTCGLWRSNIHQKLLEGLSVCYPVPSPPTGEDRSSLEPQRASWMSEMHLYMYTDLVSAPIKETRDIQGLRWFPGPVVYPLQFSLLIVDEQPQRILQLWNVLECNF